MPNILATLPFGADINRLVTQLNPDTCGIAHYRKL